MRKTSRKLSKILNKTLEILKILKTICMASNHVVLCPFSGMPNLVKLYENFIKIKTFYKI